MKYFPTIFVSVLILVATLLPGSNLPDVGFTGIDKLAHFTLFFLWILAVRYDFGSTFKELLSWLIGTAFSISTEVFQIFVDGRTFDFWDILFDCIGLTVGLFVGTFILRIIAEILSRIKK